MICVFCEKSTSEFDVFLTNGTKIHQKCLSKKYTNEKIIELVKQIDILNKNLLIYNKKYNFLEIMFFKSHQYKLQQKEKYNIKLNIDEKIKNLKQERIILRNYIDSLKSDCYDFWPDYPPDWGRRRQFIYENGCEDCGELDDFLNAHHLVPLSLGGSNKKENLIALCEPCHELRHFHKFSATKTKKSKKRSGVDENKNNLELALSAGHSIYIEYTNLNGDFSKRKISHLQFDGTRSLLKAHCHLRNEERHFKLSRISRAYFK